MGGDWAEMGRRRLPAAAAVAMGGPAAQCAAGGRAWVGSDWATIAPGGAARPQGASFLRELRELAEMRPKGCSLCRNLNSRSIDS